MSPGLLGLGKNQIIENNHCWSCRKGWVVNAVSTDGRGGAFDAHEGALRMQGWWWRRMGVDGRLLGIEAGLAHSCFHH